MKLFEDLPSTNTPINPENLNQIKDKLVIVSNTEPTGNDREKIWINAENKTINFNNNNVYENFLDGKILFSQQNTYSYNCNEMVKSGAYFYNTDTENTPNKQIAFAEWGVILTISFSNTSFPWITQIAIGNFTNTNRMATRTSTDNGQTWNEWVAIG